MKDKFIERMTELVENDSTKRKMSVNRAKNLYKKNGMLFLDTDEGKNAYDALYNAGYTMKKKPNGDVAYCIELEKLAKNEAYDENSKKQYPVTIDGLIECLQNIKSACGGDTAIQVNIYGHDAITGLVSVCLDNDMGNDEALVYIETDPDENIFPTSFEFYTQGEDIKV